VAGLSESLKRLRITGVNLFGVQVNLDELLRSQDVDERIAKLSEIKRDLEAAVFAVSSLQAEAETKKTEVETLRSAAKQAVEDEQTAEKLLTVPEESLARVIAKANARGRSRGVVEGILIGLLTGAGSSFLVWYLTQ
jgi:hypothetical protein